MTQIQAQLAKALGLDVAALTALVKQAKPVKRTKAEMLANKDKAIRTAFTKRGIKNVVLMDRTDPTKAFNVRPFGRIMEDGSKSGWLGQGRIVKKGETSVRGLFHIDQTEELPEAAE